MPVRPAGYSKIQIALHWAIVLLIIFQFLAHEGMEHSWRAFVRGNPLPADDTLMTYLHIAAGLSIFVMAVCFIVLRFRRGSPPLPDGENAALKFLARATHFVLYALIVVLPISGSIAWFLGVEIGATIHVLEKTVLLYLAIFHVIGALVQHFVLKTDVLKRMISPAG